MRFNKKVLLLSSLLVASCALGAINEIKGKLNADSLTVSNMADPVLSTDGASKNYVDTHAVSSVSGSAPIASSGGVTPTISCNVASSSQAGCLSSSDWTTFNAKQDALTLGNLTSSTTGVTVTGGTGAVVGTGTAISIQTASGTQSGLLSSSDWTTFNGKQNALGYTPANVAGDTFTGTVGFQATQWNGSTSGDVSIGAPSVVSTYSLLWPAAQASGTQYLQNDGAGNLSWATVSAGANTSLSNLSSVAVNTDLNSGVNGHNLGNYPSNLWGYLRAEQIRLYNTGSTDYMELGIAQTAPDGSSTTPILLSNVNTGIPTTALGIVTQGGFANSANILIESGNPASGTSGNLILRTGSGATRGAIKLVDGSEGTIGQVWTESAADGSGHWATVSGGANTSLSNLSGVAINADLLPATNGTKNLGGASNQWLIAYLQGVRFYNGTVTMQSTMGGPITDGVTGAVGFYPYQLSGDQTENIALITSDDGTTDATATGGVFLESGNKTSGTGNSGPIVLYTGTSVGGSRGPIKFQNGSEGTIGHVWTESAVDGSGHWATVPTAPVNGAAGGAGSMSSPSACTSDPCTVYKNPNSWITAVNRSTTGTYVITVAGGIFSSVPTCVANEYTGTIIMDCVAFGPNSTTSINVYCRENNTPTDAAFQIICTQ